VHGVRTLVDIRALPMSRRMPYIGCESLKWSCLNRRIAYMWMKALGGRRRKNSQQLAECRAQLRRLRADRDFVAAIESLL